MGVLCLWVDLERYAERIGALSKAELRVSRDREDSDEEEGRHMRKSAVKDDDDDDDWE
jgi:hypothetical protein